MAEHYNLKWNQWEEAIYFIDSLKDDFLGRFMERGICIWVVKKY